MRALLAVSTTVLVLLLASNAAGQTAEFSAGYEHVMARGGGGTANPFSLNFPGWNVSGGAYLSDRAALVGSVSGHYHDAGDVFVVLGGGQVGLGNSNVFARLLAGVERASVVLDDFSVHSTAFAFQPGIGVDIPFGATALRLSGNYRHALHDGVRSHDLVVSVGFVVKR